MPLEQGALHIVSQLVGLTTNPKRQAFPSTLFANSLASAEVAMGISMESRRGGGVMTGVRQ